MSLYGNASQKGQLRGAWLGTTLYLLNDVVQDAGSSFQALRPNINVRPSTDLRGIWAVFSSGAALPSGLMLQATYDPAASGSVLKAQSAPWSGLIGVPPSLPLPTGILGPIFWVGASYEDDLNGYYLAGLRAPYPISAYSDGHPWSVLVNQYFGQNAAPRWTPFGQAPNPLGQNYSAAGMGSHTGAQSIPNQIAQLIADYGTLPANSVVVIGAYWPNDLNHPVVGYGGVWSTGTQAWAVSPTGGFTTPASGTLLINVVSTAGMVAAGSGPGNFIYFNGNYSLAFPIVTVNSGTTVTIGAVTGLGGIPIANNTTIGIAAIGEMVAIAGPTFGNLAGAISNLVSALPSTGLVVIVNSPDISLMPLYTAYGVSSTILHNTWAYYRDNIIAPFLATTAPKVAGWDMNSIQLDAVTNYPPTASGVPSKYGFKNVNAGLGGTYLVPVPAGYNADDWIYWDGTTGVTTTGIHPTGAMQTLYASEFIKFLKIRKRLSL